VRSAPFLSHHHPTIADGQEDVIRVVRVALASESPKGLIIRRRELFGVADPGIIHSRIVGLAPAVELVPGPWPLSGPRSETLAGAGQSARKRGEWYRRAAQSSDIPRRLTERATAGPNQAIE